CWHGDQVGDRLEQVVGVEQPEKDVHREVENAVLPARCTLLRNHASPPKMNGQGATTSSPRSSHSTRAGGRRLAVRRRTAPTQIAGDAMARNSPNWYMISANS